MAAATIRPNPAGIAGLYRLYDRIHDWIVDKVEDDAVLMAPVRTGAMMLSIRSRKVAPLHSQVVVGTDHWQYVEYPTSPHVIRPRPPNQALFWPGAPHPVQMVNHPGTQAQPFMRPALYQRRTLRGRPRNF